MKNTLHNTDCLDILPNIRTQSVDLVLTDLPYKMTNSRNRLDTHLVDPSRLWPQLERIIKPNGVIALHAMQPFASSLIHSCTQYCTNIEFKYEWIWKKSMGTGFLNAKKQPLRNHECILIFYASPPTYNPQMLLGEPYKMKQGGVGLAYGETNIGQIITENKGERYPLTILEFAHDKNRINPTQKPVALAEYMIKTYTHPGETVLDCTMGSGTTIVAALKTNRAYIGIEKDVQMFIDASARINAVKPPIAESLF